MKNIEIKERPIEIKIDNQTVKLNEQEALLLFNELKRALKIVDYVYPIYKPYIINNPCIPYCQNGQFQSMITTGNVA